jgi:hypothetical protein
MAKQETLWRCSTCDTLYGSESDALKCEEKHALLLSIQTIFDNPTFKVQPVEFKDNIISEDIDEEKYDIDAEKPKDLDDINTIIITTYSTVVRRDTYQRLGTEYNPETKLFSFNEE